MEFSVKKRISRILENVERSQQLAGLSDPKQGYVAPINAYEDDFQGLQKRFGKDLINNFKIFLEENLNQTLEFAGINGADLLFNINSATSINNIPANQLFVRFGGYMEDTKSYNFNLGYKDKNNQDVFIYRFNMDLNKNINNWQSKKT